LATKVLKNNKLLRFLLIPMVSLSFGISILCLLSLFSSLPSVYCTVTVPNYNYTVTCLCACGATSTTLTREISYPTQSTQGADVCTSAYCRTTYSSICGSSAVVDTFGKFQVELGKN
jgi:hypothetical protein